MTDFFEEEINPYTYDSGRKVEDRWDACYGKGSSKEEDRKHKEYIDNTPDDNEYNGPF